MHDERRTLAHLDAETTKGRRQITVKALEGQSQAEIAEATGLHADTVHKAFKDEAVVAPIRAADLRRQAEMRKLLTVCEEIMQKDAETPLKHSDKLAAARLYAEISGLLDKTSTTVNVNVGIEDLRQLDERTLREELAAIEEQRRNVIDVDAKEL